jgi:hypothetical protein
MLSIPAAAHGRPRSEFSSIERIKVNGQEMVVEIFQNNPEGRAALMVVCIQLGPQAVAGAKRMLQIADRPQESKR